MPQRGDLGKKQRAGTSWVVQAMWKERAPHVDPDKTAWVDYATPEQNQIFDEEAVARAEFEAKVAKLSRRPNCKDRLVTLTRRGWDEHGSWIGPGTIIEEAEIDPPFGGGTPSAIVQQLRKLGGQEALAFDNARELPPERELTDEQWEAMRRKQEEDRERFEATMSPEDRAKAQELIDERRREPAGKE